MNLLYRYTCLVFLSNCYMLIEINCRHFGSVWRERTKKKRENNLVDSIQGFKCAYEIFEWMRCLPDLAVLYSICRRCLVLRLNRLDFRWTYMILHTIDSWKLCGEFLQWCYSMDHNRMNFHSINRLYWRQYHWKMLPNNSICRHNCNDHGRQIDFPLKSNRTLSVAVLHVHRRLYRHLNWIVSYAGYICRYCIWKLTVREYSADTMFSSNVCCVVDRRNNRR